MKKILGLDLGTTSIGWALVNEASSKEEQSSIIKLGVRVNPLTTDEQKNFEEGKSITTNADRTLKRSMRRNLQRYKLRREQLLEDLKAGGIISNDSILHEEGNGTTFETLRLRAKAVTEPVTLDEFARILVMLNKKRGYKTNRKFKSAEEDGEVIDSMEMARQLSENDWTPGQYGMELIQQRHFHLPDFYRSDLKEEFLKIWHTQQNFYPEELTDGLFEKLEDQNSKATWSILRDVFHLVGIKRETKGKDKVREDYEWRVKGLTDRLEPEILAIVFQNINQQIKTSSGYLGKISDRSKELQMHQMTVGQWMVEQLESNPQASLKNTVFYRQDYLDEFERIWENQKKYHPELTGELKKTLRDIVIFYQRKLKSQKGLISFCELESHEVEMDIDGKKKKVNIGPRVCPKSSPLFQEFRIWQNLNNLTVDYQPISNEQAHLLHDALETRKEMKPSEVFSILGVKGKGHQMNFEKIEGNRTMASLYETYALMIAQSGNGEYDFSKMTAAEARQTAEDIFRGLGWDTGLLHFDTRLEGRALEDQPLFMLWHLLYSYEGDNSKSGIDKLAEKISDHYGMELEYAKMLAKVTFEADYGNLSTKAIRRILPHLEAGLTYSDACEAAGYKHSKTSLTREELDQRILKDHLEELPKNSLRNPVVEKILNQMVNVVNAIIDEYGKPDEVRIELARELKKSKKERESAVKAGRESEQKNAGIKKILEEEFGFQDPSRNDIIRFKLYEELKGNGFKTLYTDTYIPREEIFSTRFDIEHILPQSRFFDDSFSNKTLELKSANIDKGNRTALDYVSDLYGAEGLARYKEKINSLFKNETISKTKRDRLLTTQEDIPENFIERDLRDSQYIAKKAKDLLNEVVKEVVTTTGSITARLREDWGLIDTMKDLNWDKYEKLGMTSVTERRQGQRIYKIENWTKRNDHRHHAMDALTIAFTKRSYIQYLNNLNARIPKEGEDPHVDLSAYRLNDLPAAERSQVVRYIESNQMERDSKNRLRFKAPIPDMREEAEQQLKQILVSIKAKNKVTTRNVNISKRKGKEEMHKVQLTPRGQLHKETIYGRSLQYRSEEVKVSGKFTEEIIAQVAQPTYRRALAERLAEFGNDPKKAFTGKNSLDKNPLYLDSAHAGTVPAKVKLVRLAPVYTIRKAIDKDLSIDKVIDVKIRHILEERLKEFDGNAQNAFSNLDSNPIWLNKEKGIQIKRVTIDKGGENVIALHDKRDHSGNLMHNANQQTIPCDFVSTGNNHHIAIYRDADGNLQEDVVSFMEATERVNLGQPVIFKEKNKDLGWEFLFTMKQNEMFVFPDEESHFYPEEIDLMDEKNQALISPHLFRVQKIAKGDYFFRHHLETNVENNKLLQNVTWKRISSINNLKGIVKVRINHLGQIVQVGE